jgi:hypothetical protein
MIAKRLLPALFASLMLLPAQAFAGAHIVIVNGNAPGVGFNDPTPAAPVGGNPGTTIGAQRLIAFQRAADVWGATLDSAVEIRILSTFEPLTCTATSAVLGSAGTTAIFAFPSSAASSTIVPNIWYHFALADKLLGAEIDNTLPHIRARFNSNLGNAGCLTGIFWYYGLDNNHGANVDLVTVLEHEFAHGLGFSQFASVTSGAQLGGLPDTYSRYIFDDTTGKHWPDMTNTERVASAVNPRHVVFDGPTVTAAVPSVLQPGTPFLQITSPAAIAGSYSVGTAAFGPALTPGGILGEVVIGRDAADGAGPSTTDGCSALTNAATVLGRIALIDRGTCGFVVKVKNAQNAGAIAVLIADNVAGGPPAGLGGADPTIIIPSVRITLADGNAIKAQLASAVTVTGSLSLDLGTRAGADDLDHALLYTPSPVAPGSTISHWDTIATPNQLMEPAINGDLTHAVQPPADLTLPLLRDVGWYPDADLDLVPDGSDSCAASDLRPTVFVGGQDTGVPNTLFTNGCTISDLIAREAAGADNHGAFVSGAAHVLNDLRDGGFITAVQKGVLQAAVARASVP